MNDFPLPFWVAAGLLAGLGGFFWKRRREGYGLPALVVLAAVGAWYLGDALYNDYALYVREFGPRILDNAWWQVVLFTVTFAALVRPLHGQLNGPLIGRQSRICALMESDLLSDERLQRRISQATGTLFGAWVALMVVALVRTDFNFEGLFLPFLAERAEPWGRARMGGAFDALVSLASYLHIFLAAAAGLALALSKKAGPRMMALIIVMLSFPFFFFGRARNMMVAVLLPGLLAWTFFRLKGGILVRAAVLVGAYLLLNQWFTFVLTVRAGGSISQAFAAGKMSEALKDKEFKHLGLNMYEELAHANGLIEAGRYQVNWGMRYFSELVNIIPRGLWEDKPSAGLDYAIARGLGTGEGGAEGGVFASISTGMIGQGVVNFGGILGPMAAALLMAIWTALLAKQDLMAEDPARLLLYGVGMILTFNLGRDITLLTLFPFVFGWLLLVAMQAWKQSDMKKSRAGRQAVRGAPARPTPEQIEEERKKARGGV